MFTRQAFSVISIKKIRNKSNLFQGAVLSCCEQIWWYDAENWKWPHMRAILLDQTKLFNVNNISLLIIVSRLSRYHLPSYPVCFSSLFNLSVVTHSSIGTDILFLPWIHEALHLYRKYMLSWSSTKWSMK